MLIICSQKSDDNDADGMLKINKSSGETQDQEDKNFAELQNISPVRIESSVNLGD